MKRGDQQRSARSEFQKRIQELEQENELLRNRLDASRDHFTRLFERTPLAYQSLDEEGRIIHVNQTWLQTLGYDRNEVLGKWYGEFLESQSLEAFHKKFPCFKEAGEIHGVELTMLRKDGGAVLFSLEGRIGYDTHGDFHRTHCILHNITAKRATELQLEQSEIRYRSFFEQSPGGILFFHLGEGDRLIFGAGNAAALAITGLSARDLEGLDFEEAFPSLAAIKEHLLAAMRHGAPWRQERLVYRTAEVERVCFGAAFQTEPGTLAVVLHDVTDRYQLEEALRHSNQMLMHIMDSIPADMFVSDVQTHEILFVNRRMRERYGGTLEGRKCWEAFRNERGPCRTCPTPLLVSGDAPATHTWEDVNPVTGRRFLNLDTLIRWTDGRRAKLQVATDVTDLRRAQEALAEAEQRYLQLFETAVIGIFRSSSEGRFLSANPALARILGYDSPEELLESITDIGAQLYVEPEERRRFNTLAAQGCGVVEQEVRMRRKDGEIIWTSESMRVAEAEPSGHMIFEGFITDITERRNIYQRLAKAKDHAEQASKSKSEFLANMSHEIRTPLNGVLGMLQLIKETPLNSEQAEMVDVALGSGRSLLTLLSDILSLSQVEAGRMVLREENFDLREIIGLVVDSLRPQTDAKSLALESRVDDSVPCLLRADMGRLRQVLFNLVGNAIKFTDKGGIRVAAALTGEAPRNLLHISVTDTGIGIQKQDQERIFEDFTQVDGSHTRRYQGAGLGLSIVRRLVRLMGGEVGIESEVGRGTEVRLHIEVKPATDEPAAHEGVCPPPRNRKDANLHVLLAEDDRVNRLTATRLLQRLGYSSRSVETGLDVLQALVRERFDCVLMDVQMPDLDGVETTKRIRAGESGMNAPSIPIIALTAHAMEGDREKFLDAGMNDYLAKPVEIGELKHTLQRSCGLEED